MVELVAEHGYSAVSVAELARRARVSKRDFYKCFASKEECFLATYDLIVNRSLRGVIAATEGEEDWRERLRLGFLAFAGQIADNPEAARLALVEVFAAGAVAVERMQRTNHLFEALVEDALADRSPRLPRLLVKGIVAGCGRVARARLLSGRPRQLALDGDELMGWVLSICDEDAGRLRGLAVAEAPPQTPAAAELPVLETPPGDERGLILAATARLARRKGFATLTVPRVCAAAGVSRRSFDAHFVGVADCFLAMIGLLSSRALVTAEPSFLTADTWESGVHRMLADLGHYLARDPTFADLAFLEVFSPDPEVIWWRSEMIVKLAAMLRREAPPARRPTLFAAEASIGAMWGVIHHFVATGRGAHLPIAAPVLSYIALAPALGGPAAVDAIVAEVGGGIETPSPERLRHPVRS
jgi:AcrR family transcriptional regulator